MRHPRLALLLALIPLTALAQSVPNPSFESGADSPASWKLVGPRGQWSSDNPDEGRRCLAISGQGADSAAWHSDPVAFAPNTLYRLTYQVRTADYRGGTLIAGPAFANRDIAAASEEWTRHDSIFLTPSQVRPDSSVLRLGQWHLKGTAFFDSVALRPAAAVHAARGDLVLGEGEAIAGNAYSFSARFGGASLNHSRPLASHNCSFNSNRWTFNANSEVVYRHEVALRDQGDASVEVAVTYHTGGRLLVSASSDGAAWQPLGFIDKPDTRSFPIPKALLPADAVWIRLASQPRPDEKSPVHLQVSGYAYKATVTGAPVTFTGSTRYLTIATTDPALEIHVTDLGDGLPGGENVVTIQTRNITPHDMVCPANTNTSPPINVTWKALEEQSISLPYSVDDTGEVALSINVGAFRAECALHVPELYSTAFGQALPAGASSSLWWASSGWKISQIRPVPSVQSSAIQIRCARNESEAAQLVLRPKRVLRNFTARATDLTGPDGATLPASAIDILRVGYVDITRPTDSTSTAAPWPDPLPPLAGPVLLEPEQNHPLWLRVNVPKTARPGRYTAKIQLTADRYQDSATLELDVYDFALPDRATCTSAFGLSPNLIWRYHNLKTIEDKRLVLDKYLASFAAHRISPYNPAPLDPFKVTWSKDRVPSFDFADWDAAMTRAFDRYHFNSFKLPIQGLGGGTFESRSEPKLLGFAENTPEYKAAFTAYCKALETHLREKGWLDYAYVYWFDEPEPKDYDFVMNGFRKLKEAAPALNRMLTEQIEPALVGGPNLWCPLTPAYDHAAAEARRQHGEKFWWYVCCAPKAPYATLFIDHPATELRVWLWQTWQRKIDGILVWESNYWTSPTAYPDPRRPQNPYEDPMGWVSGGHGMAPGTKRPWGNGDGRFLYPPEAAADATSPTPILDGPVDSIRWEMLRDGLEDYEYLAILRRLLAERRASLAPDQLAAFEQLLEVPAEITSDLTAFTTNPTPIEDHRHALAKAIQALTKQ